MKSGNAAKLLLAALAVAVVAWTASSAAAQDAKQVGVVSNIKILSDKVEDVTTLEDWKKTYIKDGMSDQEKAIAIWKTVVKYRHQTSPPNEHFVSGNVHDPMKTIHVYGYGMCCCASSNVEGLARYLGMEARGRIISAHSVPEVKVGDDWALIDGSLMNYFIKEDGKLASVDDLRKAVRGWWEEHPDEAAKMRGKDSALRKYALKGGWKNGPALLAKGEWFDENGINGAGWHGWPSNMQEYDWSDTKAAVFDYGASMGYQLNVQLRQGEKLTRNWFNKGLHINADDSIKEIIGNDKRPSSLKLQENKFNGKKVFDFPDLAPGRVGNGTLEYNVPLASGAFKLGALTIDNLACTADDKAAPAVHVKEATKPGTLVIRMPSSYIYLGGQLNAKAVVGDKGGIVVSISDNQGFSWKEVQKIEATGDQKIDLKKFIYRRYDYRVKFELLGQGTGLDSLVLTNDIQHAQTPLPLILEGENTITFAAGKSEGTITYEGSLDPDKAAGKQLSYLDFQPVVNGMKKVNLNVEGKGDITFKFNTPGEMTAIRMNLHYRTRDPKDYWLAEASFDNGTTWTQIEKFNKGQPATSQYVVFKDVPAGKSEALVRFNGVVGKNTTCMFDLRIDADYKEPNGGFKPVKITYVWEEDGKEQKKEFVAKKETETFKLTCGPKTKAKSFTVELAD